MNGSPLLKEKQKKVKRKTATQLKKILDAIFSKFIRQKYANQEGMADCYTCGQRKLVKELQNGHFVSRSYLATRYDERNCRPQCAGCNIWGGGRTVEFARKLELEEPGVVSKLYREAQKVVKDFPYEQLIEKYRPLIHD